MIKLIILHVVTITTCCGVAVKIWDFRADGHAFFKFKNISRSNLKFSTSYGRSTDLNFLFELI